MPIFASRHFNPRTPLAFGYRISLVCLSILMVIVHTLTLTHRIAHDPVLVLTASAKSAASTVSAKAVVSAAALAPAFETAQDIDSDRQNLATSPNSESATSLLAKLLTQFGHDAGDDCKSFDAATSHDTSCSHVDATFFAHAGSGLSATHQTPQILTADLLGLSLARAPPRI